MSSEDLLVADCDVLVPAALENQITTRNADRVRAQKFFVRVQTAPLPPRPMKFW